MYNLNPPSLFLLLPLLSTSSPHFTPPPPPTSPQGRNLDTLNSQFSPDTAPLLGPYKGPATPRPPTAVHNPWPR